MNRDHFKQTPYLQAMLSSFSLRCLVPNATCFSLAYANYNSPIATHSLQCCALVYIKQNGYDGDVMMKVSDTKKVSKKLVIQVIFVGDA